MGNYCSLCCYVCFKNTFYAYELADSILNKMEKHIRETIPLQSAINTWFISLKKKCFKDVRQIIACRISEELENLHFPVLTSNGFIQEHLAENLAHVLSNCLFNEEYQYAFISQEYQCLDIPTNTIFYNTSKIIANPTTLSNFVTDITNIVDEDNINHNIEINTTLDIHKKIFDIKLKEKILETWYKIPNTKIEEIINKVYQKFETNHQKEESLIRRNTSSSTT